MMTSTAPPPGLLAFSRRLVGISLLFFLCLHWIIVLIYDPLRYYNEFQSIRRRRSTRHNPLLLPTQLPIYYKARHDSDHDWSIKQIFNTDNTSLSFDSNGNRLECINLFLHRLLEKGHHVQFPLSTINHGPDVNGIEVIRIVRSALSLAIHRNPIGMWEMPLFAYNEQAGNKGKKILGLDYQGDPNIPLTARLMHWVAFSSLQQSISQMIYERRLVGFIQPLSSMHCSMPRHLLLHLDDAPPGNDQKKLAPKSLANRLKDYSHLVYLYTTYQQPDYPSLRNELDCFAGKLSAGSLSAGQLLHMMRYLRSVLFQVFLSLETARQQVNFVHGQLDFDHIFLEPIDSTFTQLWVEDEWPGSPPFPLSADDEQRAELFQNQFSSQNQSIPRMAYCPWKPSTHYDRSPMYWRFQRQISKTNSSTEFYYLPDDDSYQRIARILPSFERSRMQLPKEFKFDESNPLRAVFDYLPEKDPWRTNHFWQGFVMDSRNDRPEDVLFSPRIDALFQWQRRGDKMSRTVRIMDYRNLGREFTNWWAAAQSVLALKFSAADSRELDSIRNEFESLILHLTGDRKHLDDHSPLDHPFFASYRQTPADSIVVNLTT